jgi:ubiquinone/menaquinone biosynthesis C-methylase UbiE
MRDLHNQRTVERDAAFVVPHLRPGMRLVDLGCGTGSLTCGFAGLVAPGEVQGFDISEDAIGRARGLAEQAGLSNVRFSVANVNELELPPDSFDVAHFNSVLMHLSEPEHAVRLAFRSLKSGGFVAACEAYHPGNWAAGPHAESVMAVARALRDESAARGTDFLIGGRLRALLREAGFERVASEPGYSAAMSDAKRVGAMMRASYAGNYRPMLMRQGLSVERCDELLDEISIWAESEDSIIALAQCSVIGWKPES